MYICQEYRSIVLGLVGRARSLPGRLVVGAIGSSGRLGPRSSATPVLFPKSTRVLFPKWMTVHAVEGDAGMYRAISAPCTHGLDADHLRHHADSRVVAM